MIFNGAAFLSSIFCAAAGMWALSEPAATAATPALAPSVPRNLRRSSEVFFPVVMAASSNFA